MSDPEVTPEVSVRDLIQPMMYAVFYSIYRHSKHRASRMSVRVDQRTKHRYLRRVEMITEMGLRLDRETDVDDLMRRSSVVVPSCVATTVLTMITLVSSINSFSTGGRLRRHLHEVVDVRRVYVASLGRRVFDDIEGICEARAITWVDREEKYDVAVIARDILIGCLFGARSKKFPLRDQGLVSWTPSAKRKRQPKCHPKDDPFAALCFIDTEPIVSLRPATIGDRSVSVIVEPICLPWRQQNLKTSIARDGDDLIRRECVEDTDEENTVLKGLLFQGIAHDLSVDSAYGAICPPMHSVKVLRNTSKRYVYSTTKRGRAWGASESVLDFLLEQPTEESLHVMLMLLRRVGWIHHDFIVLCGAIPCDTGSKNMVMM